ncbi:DNA polymerase III subunit beta [Candidatus Saccharibacteria bacterium CG_4_10_14_0_2_um_filter_52_9]|nr:MAG: DNA polymerase III subunit beta [Candidatus Saccharibacteria bacterium CG_4_10_14_0_2_um_filter_52_9]
MKLQVTQENLNKALGSVARVANSRGTLPILANVLIKTSNNRLSIAATNLDIAITHYIGAKVSQEGSITVPARLMQDFVSSLPEGIIELDLQETKLHVTTDQYKSVVNGIVADDFPVMPAISGGKSWKVGGSLFKKALQQVVFAASSDETRPVLTGVLLQTLAGKLYMAATDSYRLAEKQLGANKEEVLLLIPASALHDLLRILGDADDEVTITHDDQQVLFQVGDAELVARLVDGKYPDYKKLIPENFATKATLQRADLINVTKVSSLFARESAGSVTIEVDEAAKQLSIRSVASQLGENTATAPAKVKGSGSITLNARYLLDALGALSGDEVMFGFNGKLEPTLLNDPAQPDYQHIIMPLKS